MNEREPGGVRRGLLAAVFLIALATLLFEISLTRIFSVTLWYHFGFLAIALGMLGMTAAAAACFVWRERLAGERAANWMALSALAFALAAPAAVWAHLTLTLDQAAVTTARFWLIVAAQGSLLFTVFFASGLCISIALTRHAGQFGRVYFADLVGAGLGTLLLAPLLSWCSAPAVSFAVSAAGAAACGLLLPSSTAWRVRLVPLGASAAALAALCLNDSLGLLRVSAVKNYALHVLQTAEPPKVFEKWSAVGRVAVHPPRSNRYEREMMRVTIDGGAPTNLHRFDGDVAKLQYLRRDFRQIAQHLRGGGDLLVIGSAGGRDVRAGLAFDQRSITAVEINPVTARLVTREYADYIGRIFQHPRVRFFNCEGRHFVARGRDRYDVIQIGMVDSWGGASSGAYVFNESNLYTKEAIADYLARLRPAGILSITRYYRFDEALRLANTMLEHLGDRGAANPHLSLAVVAERDTHERANVLLKNGTFTVEESQALAAAAAQAGHALVYAPHLPQSQLLDADYARTFRALIQASAVAGKRQALVACYPRDISAATDDRPFFFFMDKPTDLLGLPDKTHGSRRAAIHLLYGLFAFLALASLATVFGPLAAARRTRVSRAPGGLRLMLNAGCLGIGFMLVEMALMHKLTVLLGTPAYAFATVVGTLLLTAGAGSLASGRWMPRPSRMGVVLPPLLTAIYAAAVLNVLPVGALRTLDEPWRTALSAGLLAPLGVLMGLCLPGGIAVARRLDAGLTAWAWGVNGVCSVFGCAASLVISLHLGLSACLLCGAACYVGAMSLMAVVPLHAKPTLPASAAPMRRSADRLRNREQPLPAGAAAT